MTKNDIVVALGNSLELPKATAIQAVEGVIEILSDAFARGENVYLRGFGTLVVKTAKAKKARNISTGADVIVPAQRTVKFKISKQLKNRMNNGK